MTTRNNTFLKIALICCIVTLQHTAMGQHPSIRQQFTEIALTYQNDRILADRLWTEIDSIYQEDRRTYHNMVHLENFHLQLGKCRSHLQDYETVFMAMVYHDMVYFTKDGTNEEKSAELARDRLQLLKFPEPKIAKCVSMILATKGHAKSTDSDTNYFLDADLSILGLSPATYDAYTKGILQELGAGPQSLGGRKRFMQRFLTQDRIFHTDFFHALYEEKARENIQREIDSI